MSLDGFLSALESIIPPELIDGANVRETAKMVMLDIEYTPVVDHALGDDDAIYRYIPEPANVVKEGDRYCLVYPRTNDFQWIDAESLKVMRARYLLMRGFYQNQFDRFSYPHQQEILARFFPSGMLRLDKLFNKSDKPLVQQSCDEAEFTKQTAETLGIEGGE